jgi:hypothetical protein
MEKLINLLEACIADVKAESVKVLKGNKAAGVRLRKKLMTIKETAHQLRQDVITSLKGQG